MKIGLLYGLLLASAPMAHAQTAASAPAQPAPPAACAASENRQLDFWIGRWDVYPAKQPDKLIAHSLIERVYGGCAIRENWMPLANPGGGSLSAWVPGRKAWRQTWVDSAGSWVEFEGGMQGDALVLEGDWGKRTRMRYEPLPDGSVRQSGETLGPDGKWSPSFDLIYRRAKDPA